VVVPVCLSDKMKYLKSVARNWGNIVFAYSSRCKVILEYALFDADYYCKQDSGPKGSELTHLRHYLVRGFLQGRDPHPLFSTSYYLDNNPDVAKSGINPLSHYVLHGYKEGRNPHPLFNTSYYLEKNPDLSKSGINPLSHYVLHGYKEGRDPHPLFDTSYYFSKKNCPAADEGNPLIHYLLSSMKDKKKPHPLFSLSYYLEKNPDVEESGIDPLIHYIKAGYKEGRDPHPLFDTSYYLRKPTYSAADEGNPLIHYLLSGMKDKRSPHPLFSISYYLDNNPDLAKLEIDPLIHYLKHGYKEKRNPHQLFNTLFYCHKYMNRIGEIENPLEHFFLYGLAERTDPHPLFSTSYYLQKNPGAIELGLNPLVHFLANGYKNKNDIYLYKKHKRRRIKSILILEPGLLKFDCDSGSLRLYHIIMMLVELGYNVILWTPFGPGDERYSKPFRERNVELPFQEGGLLNYLKKNGPSIDMAILCRKTGADQFLDTIMALTDAKIVFDTVDLHYLREERKARLLNEPIDQTIKLQELHIARCADKVVVVSPIEKRMLANEGLEDKVSIVTNIHTLRPPCRSFADRTGLMFIGGFGHLPNVDGMIWFVQEIFPKIKQQIPDMHLDIVGSHPPPSIQSLSSEDITVTGYIKDVAPHFEKARVFVSPLRYGAGVKGKIGQSMAHRLPVVTTSIGAEGMHLEDGVSAMIADDESSFSQKVIELYQDQGLWEVLSHNACEIIEQYFSPEIAKKALLEMIESDRESCERS
jgi:O-antigen biosynthesis protein